MFKISIALALFALCASSGSYAGNDVEWAQERLEQALAEYNETNLLMNNAKEEFANIQNEIKKAIDEKNLITYRRAEMDVEIEKDLADYKSMPEGQEKKEKKEGIDEFCTDRNSVAAMELAAVQKLQDLQKQEQEIQEKINTLQWQLDDAKEDVDLGKDLVESLKETEEAHKRSEEAHKEWEEEHQRTLEMESRFAIERAEGKKQHQMQAYQQQQQAKKMQQKQELQLKQQQQQMAEMQHQMQQQMKNMQIQQQKQYAQEKAQEKAVNDIVNSYMEKYRNLKCTADRYVNDIQTRRNMFPHRDKDLTTQIMHLNNVDKELYKKTGQGIPNHYKIVQYYQDVLNDY
ncbi:hypothetical protein [Candidatus Hydrogenosomobacter endosymbioticus]|uniref:Uncharacterized protein n=1 Tax=Candidatus Hydrogenosomobacter endosymbioticus TaxID=2558174 RepID=A0ABM7V8I0_9PROT|nr:hypothetical protein [Candidatus Hydrogenosomobacter endosymbioticus]BDB96078.1 hypothetical protein HYD_2110 [Candidatus Hydrogenosomobacter endosymbioticus]